MKFAVLSDTHYISRRMIADTADEELMLCPAVTEQAVLQAARDNDTLIITGDLTDRGDAFSHEDFSAFLRTVQSSGKKIYVIFATHDFNHHKAFVRKSGEKIKYLSQPWSKPWFDPENIRWQDYVSPEFASLNENDLAPGLVEALGPEKIWETYYDFGPRDAYSVHAESFSYCIDLDENTRCLMLNDSFRNEEALKDKSATYSPACFRWIKQMVDEASRDGKFIFACTHHPLVPPAPAYRVGAGKENRDMRSPVPGHTLADIGIKLVFTGHTHFCNVGFLTSDNGNSLCDITVPGVRFYPPAYRNVELDGLNGRIAYDCTPVEIPENAVIAEKNLTEHYRLRLKNEYYAKLTKKAFVKKLLDELRVKDIYFLVKNKAKLTNAEYQAFKDVKLFDLLIDVAFNMLAGDGEFTPGTPVYKFMMALCTKLDSIIETQPFKDIRGEVLGGYTVSAFIEPMLFNNSVSDKQDDIDFTRLPSDKMKTRVYTSNAGDVLMAFVWVLAVILSFFAPALTAVGIPALVIRKKLNDKKDPKLPKWKY